MALLVNIPIWVVNLERSTDRRSFMAKQLSDYGVHFEFFPAIDGQKLTWRELLNYSPLKSLWTEGRLLARNEIGCALTHASIYQRIVNENFSTVLVLEDDAVLDKDLFLLLDARENFPQDWELINFRTDARKIPLSREAVVGRYKLCNFAGTANGTVAYLINQKGAKKLWKHVLPIRYPADGFQGRAKVTELIAYGIEPQPVSLAHFPSEIWQGAEPTWEASYWKFTRRYVKNLKRLLYRLSTWIRKKNVNIK